MNYTVLKQMERHKVWTKVKPKMTSNLFWRPHNVKRENLVLVVWSPQLMENLKIEAEAKDGEYTVLKPEFRDEKVSIVENRSWSD